MSVLNGGLLGSSGGGGGGGGLSNIVEDLSPELGADLDVLGFAVTSSTANLSLETAFSGGDVIAVPDVTAGKFIVQQGGGTPGTHEIQLYHDGVESWIWGQAGKTNLLGNTSTIIWTNSAKMMSANVNDTSFHKKVLSSTSAYVDLGGPGTTSFGNMYLQGSICMMTGLPTSDPTNTGQLWNNSGVVTVSA